MSLSRPQDIQLPVGLTFVIQGLWVCVATPDRQGVSHAQAGTGGKGGTPRHQAGALQGAFLRVIARCLARNMRDL